MWILILSALRLDHENLATETFWDKGPLCTVGSDRRRTAQQSWKSSLLFRPQTDSSWDHLWVMDTWTCWPWRRITLDRRPNQRGLIQLAFPHLKYKLMARNSPEAAGMWRQEGPLLTYRKKKWGWREIYQPVDNGHLWEVDYGCFYCLFPSFGLSTFSIIHYFTLKNWEM